MSKIKFHLYKLEKRLVFQIIDQSPSITRDSDTSKVLYLDDSIGLISANYPEIRINDTYKNTKYDLIVFIRGNKKERDLHIIQSIFRSNEERDNIYDKILTLMSKI